MQIDSWHLLYTAILFQHTRNVGFEKIHKLSHLAFFYKYGCNYVYH